MVQMVLPCWAGTTGSTYTALLSASPLPECETAASAVLSVQELHHARAKPSIFTPAWAHTDKQRVAEREVQKKERKKKKTNAPQKLDIL